MFPSSLKMFFQVPNMFPKVVPNRPPIVYILVIIRFKKMVTKKNIGIKIVLSQ